MYQEKISFILKKDLTLNHNDSKKYNYKIFEIIIFFFKKILYYITILWYYIFIKSKLYLLFKLSTTKTITIVNI